MKNIGNKDTGENVAEIVFRSSFKFKIYYIIIKNLFQNNNEIKMNVTHRLGQVVNCFKIV